jgi:hypothetical protein
MAARGRTFFSQMNLGFRGAASLSDFASTLALLMAIGSGCGKPASATKEPAEIESKLATIRQAGEPVTTVDLNAWYIEPPSGENAAPSYADAFKALATNDSASAFFVASNQQALQLLHQAATRHRCRYPIDLKNGYVEPLPHLKGIRICAKLLAQAAASEADKMRLESAAQYLMDDLGLIRSLEQEPTMISQHIRGQGERAIVAGLERVLSREKLTDADLLRLQAGFEEAEKTSEVVPRGLIGDRCIILAMFRSSDRELAEALHFSGATFDPPFLHLYRNSSTNWADFGFSLDVFENLIAATKMPFPDALDAINRCKEQIAEAPANGFLISSIILTNVPTLVEGAAVPAAEMREAAIALAIERYRIANGSALPLSLTSLTPKFLKAIPTDPFDGKLLRYQKKSSRGYTIYSVGPDRHDDNGTPPKKGSPPGTKFDIVFEVAR